MQRNRKRRKVALGAIENYPSEEAQLEKAAPRLHHILAAAAAAAAAVAGATITSGQALMDLSWLDPSQVPQPCWRI